MKLEIFAVYDAATGAFLQPFFSPSKGAALRSLTDAVNDEKHEFSRHSSDYTLFILGSWDDNSGVFTSSVPERVVGCLELVVKKETEKSPFVPIEYGGKTS